MEMRDVLIYFALKYEGNWEKILNAIENQEQFTTEQYNKIVEKQRYDCVTLIDDNYPEFLKEIVSPPIALFYKGNLKLLDGEHELVAKATDDGVRMLHTVEPSFTKHGIELDYIMACECHDDMDMLLERMDRTQEILNKCVVIKHERDRETHLVH